MSAWSGEALKQFPELQEKILKAESHEEVWNSVKAAYKGAVETGQTDFVTGVLKFAVFFLRSRAQAAKMPSLSKDAAEFLYTNLDILHLHLTRQDLMKGQVVLKVILGESRYGEFDSRFYGRFDGYPNKP
jgi:hypothetical protein